MDPEWLSTGSSSSSSSSGSSSGSSSSSNSNSNSSSDSSSASSDGGGGDSGSGSSSSSGETPLTWEEFSAKISTRKAVGYTRTKDTIQDVLKQAASVEIVPCAKNDWYNIAGVDEIQGFTYVDQDHSYFGNAPVLVGEASHCVLLVAIDSNPTGGHFVCHIGADSADKPKEWKKMTDDFGTFLQSMASNGLGPDLGRPNIYMFSNSISKGEAGGDEHTNVMKLLSSSRLSNSALGWLAMSTSLIEGEAGQKWNAYCSVRLGKDSPKHRMHITFATTQWEDYRG